MSEEEAIKVINEMTPDVLDYVCCLITKYQKLENRIMLAKSYITKFSFYDESGKEVMDEPNKLLKILGGKE